MNVSDRLANRLSDARLRVLANISSLAARQGMDVYLVGGSVRDILANSPVLDIDVMASGGSARLVESILAEDGAEMRKSSAFGTWTLAAAGGVQFDLSTARRETYDRPGALPTVAPGTILDDLARRDFSVNAMAISLAGNSWGDLLDPHGGVRDLERGVLRVLHDRSFENDATRILRAVRYSRRACLSLEPRTATLLERGLSYLETISGDRIRREIERIFLDPQAAAMLETADDWGVLRAIHPALRVDLNALRSVGGSTGMDAARRSALLLAATVHSVRPCDVESVIRRLNMGSEWGRIIRDTAAVRGLLPALADAGAARSRVRRLLDGLHPIAVESLASASDDPLVAGRLREYIDELRHIRPMLDGGDLIAMGAAEGPLVGALLAELLDARVDGLIETIADEREMARRSIERARSMQSP